MQNHFESVSHLNPAMVFGLSHNIRVL